MSGKAKFLQMQYVYMFNTYPLQCSSIIHPFIHLSINQYCHFIHISLCIIYGDLHNHNLLRLETFSLMQVSRCTSLAPLQIILTHPRPWRNPTISLSTGSNEHNEWKNVGSNCALLLKCFISSLWRRNNKTFTPLRMIHYSCHPDQADITDLDVQLWSCVTAADYQRIQWLHSSGIFGAVFTHTRVPKKQLTA